MAERADDTPKKDLKFPVLCHYKIITEDMPAVERSIRAVLIEFGIQRPLLPGHRSKDGKYLTFNVEVIANSKEFMDRLDARLRAIDGVRFVL